MYRFNCKLVLHLIDFKKENEKVISVIPHEYCSISTELRDPMCQDAHNGIETSAWLSFIAGCIKSNFLLQQKTKAKN